MYETCIFDLYGTLVDIRTEESGTELWEKLALFYGYYGACYQGEELHQAFLQTVQEMEAGHPKLRQDSHEAFPEIEIERVFEELYRKKGVSLPLEHAVYTGQLFRILSTEYLRLYEGTRKMLETLKKHGKKMYLLSNAQKIFTEYEMRALDIANYFDGIFISSEHGVKKPDVRFFEKLLETYGICREQAIMIGNDGICDIEGAKEAGLATLYVHSNLSPEEDAPNADYLLEEMDPEKMTEILLS